MQDPFSFAEYQLRTPETAVYPPERALEYLALGLASEAGEVAGKVAKVIRGDRPLDEAAKRAIGEEMGGVLWNLAELATTLGLDLGSIAEDNLEILADRKRRGVIKGDGDNR